MIPDDEEMSRFFVTALPAAEVVRAAMAGTGSIKKICGETVPTADIVMRWLRRSTRPGTAKSKCRVWLGGRELPVSDRIAFAESPQHGDTLESWVRRCVGQCSFAVHISLMEEIDEILAYSVARYLAPEVRRQQPLTSISLACIFGRYDTTPFDIHKDDNVTGIVHFHLGPGTKALFFWRNDKNLPPNVDTLPLPEALASAESVKIEKGDGLTIAPTDTHVGKAADLCANLILLFKNTTSAKVVERVRQELKWFRNEPVLWGKPAPASSRFFPESWLRLTGEEIYQTAFELHRMALASNGGLGTSPIPRADSVPPRTKVRLTKAEAFPLLFQESHGQLVVAARGRLRAWTLHPDMSGWLDRLASGVVTGLDDLQYASNCKAILGELAMCLTWLYKMRVLDLVSRQHID